MSVLSKPSTSHSFRVSYRISHPQKNSLISMMEEEEEEEKEEGSLGYYADGVKRTLRQSEIYSLLRARQLGLSRDSGA
jgi:uncharacterized protein DUF3807